MTDAADKAGQAHDLTIAVGHRTAQRMAPVTGGVGGVEKGTLGFMGGSNGDDFVTSVPGGRCCGAQVGQRRPTT